MAVDRGVVLQMVESALRARERAYSPYSMFAVGAAALGGSGQVYVGCNVENASFGLTVCAERIAILKAISEGEQTIRAIAIAGGDKHPARPCGACLQVMAEFAPRDESIEIYTCTSDRSYESHTLEEYLPMPFELEA